MTPEQINSILSGIIPKTPQGADTILDLREVLLKDGHPGKCVSCFFSLVGQTDQHGALAPLRLWLEQHIELRVSSSGKTLETLPVSLGEDFDLYDYCDRAIQMVREDRAYSQQEILLNFQYRATSTI